MKQKNTAFDYANIAIMVVLMIIMIYPLWYIIVGSLNEGTDYMRGGVYFWPREFTLANYQAIFYENKILSAFKVTVLKCVIGTITSVFTTTLVAYGITRPNLKFKNFYIPYIMFPMFFSGGLIPYFMLINNIGLYDTFWVYIIPSLFSIWNMIIIQSFLRDLPSEIFEAAKIDGAGEYRIFFKIVIPLSKPVIATISLFTIVTHWNSYFDSMMYTNSSELQTIQYYLRQVIADPAASDSIGTTAAQYLPDGAVELTSQSVKFATMTITALPVIAVYPFLQRYFVKGVTIGAVKG